jgi:hypothetical protein
MFQNNISDIIEHSFDVVIAYFSAMTIFVLWNAVEGVL